MKLTSRPAPADASAVRLRLVALPENVMLVRQALDGAARELGASTEVIDDLKLAVTEACSNVVKYAYRESPGDLEVTPRPRRGRLQRRESGQRHLARPARR